MQIQARASRGVKSRRVGGGSNFHETFPRMNEGRRVERLRVLGESLPIVDTFIFVVPLLSPRFSIVFPSDSSPSTSSAISRALRSSLIDRRSLSLSFASASTTFLREELVASRPRYPIAPSSPRDLISGYREEVFPKFSKYTSRRDLFFRRKSRVVESQMQLDSWLHEKNSAGWSIHRRFRWVHAL